jgi:hypothetical protein
MPTLFSRYPRHAVSEGLTDAVHHDSAPLRDALARGRGSLVSCLSRRRTDADVMTETGEATQTWLSKRSYV